MKLTQFSSSNPEPSTDQQIQKSHCWNRVGVYGDRTCSELTRYIHCRNCPVYSAAALQLLSRPSPAGYRQECTAHFGNQRARPDTKTTSAVVFRITTNWLAIPTQVLQEVAEYRPLHSLPHRRKGFILGLANVRGELLLCISLAHFLQLENTASREALQRSYHRLLTANWEGDRFAFPVHEVHGPHRFQFQDIRTFQPKVEPRKSVYTHKLVHWRQRTVGLLNPQSLFPALNRNLT